MQVVKWVYRDEVCWGAILLILIVLQFRCSDIEKRINVSPNQLLEIRVVSDIHEHIYADHPL